MEEILAKQNKLEEILRGYGKVAVAFSSGVDSTYLLAVARKVLKDNVIAVTATSNSFPQRELNESNDFCGQRGIEHYIVKTNELEIEGFRQNPVNRCYLCKREIFKGIMKVAAEHGTDIVLEASNTDDDGDYRPGHIAIKELGIKSPLRQAGMSKADIRALSKIMDLPTWDKPSFACLATRFVYGQEITKEKLEMVDKSEQLLLDMGFRQMRVRIHDDIARIEIDPSDFELIMREENRNRIINSLTEYGFRYVTLDLKGYRTGSMNEILSSEVLKQGTGL